MDKPVRVLQIFTTMNRGGAESMIMNYYRHIDRNKIQFDFLVHREEKGAFEDEIEQLGGKIYRMPKINPLFPYPYYKRLDTFFKQHRYKLVHSHINTFSQFPLKIAKQNNIPCRIAHAHIASESVVIKNIFSKNNTIEELKKIAKLFLKKNTSKYASQLFSCGIKAGEWLFGDSNSFLTVNNSIDSGLFKYDALKSKEYKKEFQIGENVVFGHVGRFNHQKNHFFLVRTFKAIHKLHKNSKLILVGDGELRHLIEEEIIRLGIQDNVLFLGVRSDIPALLQMMDVFIMPSFFEGLPVTLIEAQTTGLKIFASTSITKEVALTDDITFLSLDKSPQYWAEQILKAVPYVRKDNSAIIKAKGYDIEDNAKRLENFYLEQVNKLY